MAVISAYLGYLLGLKSQRTQALREYVADIVQAKYPALSSEINRNIDVLDGYLEDPLECFEFRQLDQFYDDGLDEFMKKYHKDLFLSIDYLKQGIAPKLYELHHIVVESINKIYENWNSELYRNLPREVNEKSRNIAHDLIKSIGSNYVLKDLLNDRKDAMRRKVEACIIYHTAIIYQEKEIKAPIVIRGLKKENIDYNKVFNKLLKTAQSEIARILELYTELQKQINEKVKRELLPLLRKYISNPI